MVGSFLPALTLIAGSLSIPVAAETGAGIDQAAQTVPAGMIRTIRTAADGQQTIVDTPFAGQSIPGAVTVTTVETTEEDEDGNAIQTFAETRIEPVSMAGYSAPFQQGPLQQASFQRLPFGQAPAFGQAPVEQAPLQQAEYLPMMTSPAMLSPAPTPHLNVDLAALMDSYPAAAGLRMASVPQSLRIPRDRETGHFIAAIAINGVPVRAIIDTGAQETILSARDARATGANRDIVSTEPMAGIGGYTTLNVTRVHSMEVAGQQLGGFTAAIGQEGIPYTLLGQTEIARLGRIEIENGVMTITPPRTALIALR